MDDNLRLTEPDKQRIQQALVSRAALRPCAACANNSFTLADHLAMIKIGPPGHFPGITMPSAVLVCSRCGDTRFHNVILLGLGAELGVSK